MKLKSLCGRFSERKNWEGPQYVHCGSTSWNCYLRYQSSRQCPRMTFRNSTISRDPCSAFFRSSGLQSSGGHIPFLLPQNDETKAVTSRSSLYQAPWLRSPRHLIKRRPCAEVWSFYSCCLWPILCRCKHSLSKERDVVVAANDDARYCSSPTPL